MPSILLLHGNHQTHDIFHTCIKPLTKKLTKQLNYTFSTSDPDTNGPIIHPVKDGDDTPTFGWFDSSLSQLSSVLDNLFLDFQKQKYEGIIAFSQGALLAHFLLQDSRFTPYLKWVILASAPYLSSCYLTSAQVDIPSLHVIGEKDVCVSPSSSLKISGGYNNPKFHKHGGGHHIPMRSADLKVYLDFVEGIESVTEINEIEEDVKEEQMDELLVLQELYPSDYTLLSKLDTFPLRFKIRIFDYKEKCIYVEFKFPFKYPESESPEIILKHDLSLVDFRSYKERCILGLGRRLLEEGKGECCVMNVVEGVREWFYDGGMEEKEVEEVEEEEEEEEEETEEEFEERLKSAENCGLEIAMKHVSSPKTSSHPQKGGSQTITIGLIGKPSAGKSTFFNSATAFSRQSGGGEGAKMGETPFTTIDPNLGYGYAPVETEVLPDGEEFGSEYGRDILNSRLTPVLIKDVAGLVPGAWKGLGKGNKFLDDLCDANVLICVSDCSGKSDRNGVIGGRKVEDGGEEWGWIRRELVMWVEGNVWGKFEGVRRLGRERLGRLFTGYRQRNEMIENVLDALEVQGYNVEDFVKWTRVDVRRLVSCFLGFRFPTVLACNKIDKADEGVLESLLGKLPMHGVRDGVGVCASNECEIVRRAIDGKDISDLEITENVWKTISKGISMSSTVFVFPVIDLSTCMALPSMIRNVEGGGGSTSATAISENHKKSILARGGKGPEPGKLQICVCMKEGSTVSDVYDHLKNIKAVSGMFVRAEGMSNIGDKSRQLKKEEVVNSSNRIMRIMTNKNRAHHESGGGSGGGDGDMEKKTVSKNKAKFSR
ncbi:hypothetical protein TL16_g10205 [Triparma laevis f. inornata]|uniref:RWD domain-containing protein n=1 Tax=Triparma laevis f. inornata TaxID=1714386 RepID=A0A9W7BFS5_9STRA|nr:hypothetical protein TL16_g10205 [Triparma laevis f. inornata]